MSVYVIGQIKITDEAKYRKYEAQAARIFSGMGARILALDEAPRVLEGNWPFNQLVIIEFYDVDHAKRTLTDPSYLRILQDRIEGAEVVGVLVQGV